MKNRGDHTWERYLHYHCCPECNYVFENQSGYVVEQGQKIKELICPRCKHAFTVKKEGRFIKPPLFGRPQPPEMEWE